MLNKVIIMGRLAREPEMRSTESGVSVSNFVVAVEQDYKSPSGERKADFLDVVAWRNTAEFVCGHFHKGNMICLEGKIQTRNYTDKEGNNRKAVEIQADSVYFTGEKRQDNNGGIPGNDALRYAQNRAASPAPKGFVPDLAGDEDTPF